MKTNTHIVIKREDIFKYLTDEQTLYFDAILNIIADGRKKDGKKAVNSFYICNTDEPYADEVLEIILKAESEGRRMINKEPYEVPRYVEPFNKQHFFRCLKRNGLTEAKIAEAIGVSPETIQRAVATGKIDSHYLEQMASIMNEDPNYISGIEKEMYSHRKGAIRNDNNINDNL